MIVASLVFGILSIVIGALGFFAGPLAIVGLVLGILGIVFASILLSKKRKAVGGLVCSIIGTVFCIIPAAIWIMALAAVAAGA